MAAIASIKFTQGPNTDVAGRAVIGTVFATDGSVAVTNGDNTDVNSWDIDLLDAPTDSANYPLATFDNGSGGRAVLNLASAVSSTPSASFDPDVVGSYRIRTTVRNSSGIPNVDIRVFGVPDALGLVRPPYQKVPDPLPVLGSGESGAKADEMNFGGQIRGWAGTSSPILLDQFLRILSLRRQILPFLSGVSSTDTNGYIRIGSLQIDSSKFSAAAVVTLRAIIETSNVLYNADLRIFNVTDAVVVGADPLVTTALLTPTAASAAFTPAVGVKLYELQMSIRSPSIPPDEATCSGAYLEVVG